MDAHYHLHIAIGKRTNRGLVIHGDGIGDGQSATAAVDYALRGGKYRDSGDEVICLASANMPRWGTASSSRRHQAAGYSFWKACDRYERANGVLYVVIVVALPDELPAHIRLDLAIRFARKLAGMATDIGHPLPWFLAVHRKPDDQGVMHEHAHIVISPRGNDHVERPLQTWFRRANGKNPAQGGARKSRCFQPKKWLQDVRKLWESMGNAALMKAAALTRLDCRSYRARGIDRRPGIHLGPMATTLNRDGKSSRRLERLKAIEAENEERATLQAARAELDAKLRRAKELELLAMLVDHCGDDLVELFGPDYLDAPAQRLPPKPPDREAPALRLNHPARPRPR